LNEIPPAQRGTTPTDSFTDSIVLSGSTAVRSALRATGKDPSDEVISVADEKDGHSVSLLFLSFFLLIKKDLIVASLVDSFFFIPAARHHLLLHHLFPLTPLVLSFSISFNTIS
jgi:hypothetical protein